MIPEKIVPENTGLDSKFVTLEPGKALYFEFNNWRTVEEIDATGKPYNKWKADVHKYGESLQLMNVCTSPKIFSSSHVDFRKKINLLLAGKDKSFKFTIRVKIVDDKAKPIKYDVEFA